MKLLSYASSIAASLWLLAQGLIVVSLFVGLSAFESTLVAAFGGVASLMITCSLIRQLAPVAYSFVVRGTWPTVPAR